MIAVILAGGSGTRLWPLSRKNFPKQFLKLSGTGDKSLIQETASRLSLAASPSDIYVVAGEDYRHTISDHLGQLFGSKYENMILEPCGRNTAPAIALTVKALLESGKATPDTVLFFSPSDHLIEPKNKFAELVLSAEKFAADSIVTFGIVPDKPETGYGYIELGKNREDGFFQVKRFVEKPVLEKAKEYLASGAFMWNSGMFMFSIRVILEAFKKYAPNLFDAVQNWTLEKMLSEYSSIPSISIDYAVMEKADNIVCLKTPVRWNDVGSWDSVYEVMDKDPEGNAVRGDVETLDVKNSLVLSNKKLTALIGVENVVVIETEDAILVSDRSRTQNVKEMVDLLKNKKRSEVVEHTTTYRPWGSYTILEASDRYKIKKIVVNQGASLSLQRHAHRSEHWVVVRGTALVQVGSDEIFVHENESTYIPKSTVHRLSNPGKIPLEIIEVQNGEYVGEDDIERIEDNYGRAKP